VGKAPVGKNIIELPSNPQEVTKVERFIEKLNKQLGLDDTRYNKLLVAVTEAVNNGIIHGNRKDPSKKVIMTCEVTPSRLIIRVQDEGPGIDPDTLPDPLAEENLLRENGRGVFLMRSLMDEVTFERFEGGSAVTMTLKLS
jgi:serine/threonine-protein kinase RsbW